MKTPDQKKQDLKDANQNALDEKIQKRAEDQQQINMMRKKLDNNDS